MKYYYSKKTFLYILFDLFAVNAAIFLAHYFRLGSRVFERMGPDYYRASALASGIFLLCFILFRFYRRVWIHASYEDYMYAIGTNLLAGMLFLSTQIILKQMILSLIVLATILVPMMTVGGRALYRILKHLRHSYRLRRGKVDKILVVGESGIAMQVAKKLKLDASDERYPVGVIGMDDTDAGRFISGVPIIGSVDTLEDVISQKKADGVLVVTDNLTRRERYYLFRRIRRLGIRIEVTKSTSKDSRDLIDNIDIAGITINELFGKEDIELDYSKLCKGYDDKRILITGAAGIIGTRIGKTLVKCKPEKIILLDVNENGLQKTFDELKGENPELDILPVFVSLNDANSLDKTFMEEKPNYILHAAFLNKSYLSEKNPEQVVKNNILGSYNLVEAANKYNCKKVMMISSNSARDPKNIACASKRICEMMFQGANQRYVTDYSVVRFPELDENAYFELERHKETFEKENRIEVRNPDRNKYTFGYADASNLVLKAMSIAKGGETFILYPGEPVTSADIARAFITNQKTLFRMKEEIDVTYTQEPVKEDEDPKINYDELNPTDDENIYLDRPVFDDYVKLTEKISGLEMVMEKADYETVEKYVMNLLKDLVPSYKFMDFGGGADHYLFRKEDDEKKRIWLSSPHMGGLEQHFVKEAFDDNWISPVGPNIYEFEREMAKFLGVKDAVAMVSGTAAIHIALRLLRVSPGDEILCSSLTFAGSTFPILYEKAVPVFIDSTPDNWNISPAALERALDDSKKKGILPKAVIAVNLYGQSTDFDSVLKICDEYKVPVIEDAAESLGATYAGRQTGSFGKFGVFSFNGNKIITTSGGGMLVSDDEAAMEKARFLITQAKDKARYYQHSEVGFNYRMSNVVAGIGRGQLKVLDIRINQKREIYEHYRQAFEHIKDISMMPLDPAGDPNYWLSVITISEKSKVNPLDIILALEKEDIESRPVWKPLHLQPVFRRYPFYSHHDGYPSVSKKIFDSGVCLPSDTKMTKEDLDRICNIIKGLW